VTQPEPLPGSEVPARPGSELAGPADPGGRLVISMYVSRPPPAAGQARPDQAGVPAGQLSAVTDWARGQGLEVAGTDLAAGRVQLAGTVAALERAFGTELLHYRQDGRDYVSYRGPLHVPAQLRPTVRAVLGLDTYPIAHRC
jgi:kumamolisin